MNSKTIKQLAALSLMGLGIWQATQGAYIYAKAYLARVLIDQAWHQSLAGSAQAKPWPWADTWPVARLLVPSHDIDLIVLAGDSGRTLAFGPGFRLGSAMPGSIGTSLISGHRDTHFDFLKNLKAGDEIILHNTNGQVLAYEVMTTAIIHEQSPIYHAQYQNVLSLVTCYPFDSIVPGGEMRYVVNAMPKRVVKV